MFDGACDDSVWLDGDLEILGRCDVIVMMDGWQESNGASRELDVAFKLDKEIIYDAPTF